MTTLDVPRICRTATENNDTATTVDLFLGDAVFRPGDTNIAAHPLDATRLEEPYDIVFGLDCVYHFQTRTKFLAQAHAALKPGGRIALADICFGPMPVFVRWLVTKLFVPSENVQTWADYGHTLDRLGYVNVEMEDITAEVYPSFVSFLKSRGVAWWIFGSVFRCLIVPYSRFVLVSAQKP
jgi:SAM-dependent methyltransferase